MAASQPGTSGIACGALLRRELSERNRAYAAAQRLIAYESRGEVPTIVYEPSVDGMSHGNFLTASYRAILANPEWRRRLDKSHAQARNALPRNIRREWKELDSSNSSDALLMNVFCYPRTLEESRVYSLLGVEVGAMPLFGFKARVPLLGGRLDRTEVDMRLDNLLVEAKLTESDFQQKSPAVVETYRDLREVFDYRRLPRDKDLICGYQLIRNILAAYASGCTFCVLLDARRPDLRENFFQVLQCIKPADLRLRCKLLTWQELAESLPHALQQFLVEKYGINAGQRFEPAEGAEAHDFHMPGVLE